MPQAQSQHLPGYRLQQPLEWPKQQQAVGRHGPVHLPVDVQVPPLHLPVPWGPLQGVA